MPIEPHREPREVDMQARDLLLEPADPLGELVKAPIDVIEPLMAPGFLLSGAGNNPLAGPGPGA